MPGEETARKRTGFKAVDFDKLNGLIGLYTACPQAGQNVP
jgi:hypothetical protein